MPTVSRYAASSACAAMSADAMTRSGSAARSASDIYESIDALLEKAECDLMVKYLSARVGKRALVDDEDNEYIEGWIEYLESRLNND